MTAADVAEAVGIWRNGRTQRGTARRDRIVSAEDAIAQLQQGRAMVCVAVADAERVRAWVGERVRDGETA